MGKNVKIKGLNSLKRKLRDTEGMAKELIDSKGGIDAECPKCHKTIKVPTSGVTCSCGQKITLELKK